MTILENFYGRLKGQTAWITGGKRIGQTVGRALAEQGVNLVVSYKGSLKEAEDLVSMAKGLGVKAMAVQADVSSRESVQSAVAEVAKAFPEIHLLVHMASVFKPKRFEDVTEEELNMNIEIHIKGTFWMAQLIAPLMPPGAHVVNIADRTSVARIYPGFDAYVMTKGAIATLTRDLAVTLGPKGVFVNALAPGPVLRPEDIPEAEWKKFRESSIIKFPITDEDAVEEFAMLVLYLSAQRMASGNLYLLDQGHSL